jgi:hypothetical protein
MDLKFLKRAQFGKQKTVFAAHDADYVIAYSPMTNYIYLYKQSKKYKDLYVYMNINKELSIKNTETGLNETPLSKLIP